MPWFKQKSFLVFIVIFIHATLLDLFFVTYNGPVFLWEENLHWLTIVTHLAMALVMAVLYELSVIFRRDFESGNFVLRERVMIGCSICIFISIVFLLS